MEGGRARRSWAHNQEDGGSFTVMGKVMGRKGGKMIGFGVQIC